MADATLDQIATYIHDLIDTNKTALGLKRVQFGDESLTPDYPCVVVLAGDLTRTPTASGRTTTNDITVMLYVLHADMSLTRTARTHADLQLAAAVTSLLHGDFTMGGLVAGGGWVSHERPRGIPYRKALNVISTELTWHGTGRGLIF